MFSETVQVGNSQQKTNECQRFVSLLDPRNFSPRIRCQRTDNRNSVSLLTKWALHIYLTEIWWGINKIANLKALSFILSIVGRPISHHPHSLSPAGQPHGWSPTFRLLPLTSQFALGLPKTQLRGVFLHLVIFLDFLQPWSSILGLYYYKLHPTLREFVPTIYLCNDKSFPYVPSHRERIYRLNELICLKSLDECLEHLVLYW